MRFLGRIALYAGSIGIIELADNAEWFPDNHVKILAWFLGGVAMMVIYETGLWRSYK